MTAEETAELNQSPAFRLGAVQYLIEELIAGRISSEYAAERYAQLNPEYTPEETQ